MSPLWPHPPRLRAEPDLVSTPPTGQVGAGTPFPGTSTSCTRHPALPWLVARLDGLSPQCPLLGPPGPLPSVSAVALEQQDRPPAQGERVWPRGGEVCRDLRQLPAPRATLSPPVPQVPAVDQFSSQSVQRGEGSGEKGSRADAFVTDLIPKAGASDPQHCPSTSPRVAPSGLTHTSPVWSQPPGDSGS